MLFSKIKILLLHVYSQWLYILCSGFGYTWEINTNKPTSFNLLNHSSAFSTIFHPLSPSWLNNWICGSLQPQFLIIYYHAFNIESDQSKLCLLVTVAQWRVDFWVTWKNYPIIISHHITHIYTLEHFRGLLNQGGQWVQVRYDELLASVS
jgi:hypothetical protein